MAYEELADRIRELIAGAVGLAEQKMFGGVAFLIGFPSDASESRLHSEMRGDVAPVRVLTVTASST